MTKPGIYRHFKGGLYSVLGVAIHTEAPELMVIYTDADGELFARPEAMFHEFVFHEGTLVSRFKKLSPPT